MAGLGSVGSELRAEHVRASSLNASIASCLALLASRRSRRSAVVLIICSPLGKDPDAEDRVEDRELHERPGGPTGERPPCLHERKRPHRETAKSEAALTPRRRRRASASWPFPLPLRIKVVPGRTRRKTAPSRSLIGPPNRLPRDRRPWFSCEPFVALKTGRWPTVEARAAPAARPRSKPSPRAPAPATRRTQTSVAGTSRECGCLSTGGQRF